MGIVREKRKMKNHIGNIDIYFLEHGTVEGGPAHDDFELFLKTDEEWKNLWTEQRDKILESWIREHPCSRPWAWWKFDAPEPRRRIGGVGTPSHEVLSVAPCYEFGLPTGWIGEFEERHFENCKGLGINVNDPPIFESQATYLNRHGLLTESEKKYLQRNLELLESEKINIPGLNDDCRDGDTSMNGATV